MFRFLSLIEDIASFYAVLVVLFPLGFFYLPTLILNPSLISVLLCLEGFLIGLLCYVSLLYYEDKKRLKELISGYLEPFGSCDFYKYEISDYAPKSSTIQMEASKFSFSISGHTYWLNLFRNIYVYVVKRGRSSIVPSQLVAYETLEGSSHSYIFIRDEPTKILPIGKFFIYHEIGHASWDNATFRIIEILGWKLFLLPIFGIIIVLQPNILSIGSLVIYISLLLIMYPFYNRWLKYSRLIDELNADKFALRFLSEEDREDLLNLIASGNLPKDKSMNDLENIDRSEFLMADLRKIVNSKGNDYLPEYLISKPINNFLITFAILVPVIGIFHRTQSMRIIYLNFFLVFILIVLILWSVYKRNVLQKEIESRLSNSIA